MRKLQFVLALSSLTYFPQVALASHFTGLGDLSGGDYSSIARAVSADGSVIVGDSMRANGREAFRWTVATGMVGLGGNSQASGISDDGSVIIGNVGGEGFRWTTDDGMIGTGKLSGGSGSSENRGISGDGQVVTGVSSNTRGFREAYRWTETDGLEGLAGASDGHAASGDGSVIVGEMNVSGGIEAFRWTQETGKVGLGNLSGGNNQGLAWDVTSDGSIIVGESDSATSLNGREAFYWTESEGMVGLGYSDTDSYSSVAYGISDDGLRIVGSSGSGEAALWDEDRNIFNLQTLLSDEYGLDITGWDLEAALAISADGSTIVGWGYNPDGNKEAWVANISAVPVPAAVWLFSSGLIGLIGFARRKANG